MTILQVMFLAVKAERRAMLRLAAVVLLAMFAMGVQARNVGDMFVYNKTLYRIIALSPLEVEIIDTEQTGAVTFPAEVTDSTSTAFKVVQMAGRAAGQYNKQYGLTSNVASITSITFSEGLRKIGFWAFYGYGVTTLSLPATLEDFGIHHSSLTKVESITIADGNPYLKMEGGVMYSADGKTLKFLSSKLVSGTTFTFPEGVTTIPEMTIINTNITKFVLPSTLESIALHGYANYLNTKVQFEFASDNPNFSVSSNGYELLSKDGTELYYFGDRNGTTISSDGKKVYKNPNIKVLHHFCFSGVNVDTVNLKNLERIEGSIFYFSGVKNFVINSKLESITGQTYDHEIPVTIGSGGYMGYRPGLQKYHISKEGNNYFAVDASGVLYTKDYKELLHCPTAFYNTASTKERTYSIHQNCKVIKQMAFGRCFYNDKNTTNVTVVFPAGLEEIEYGAFFRCNAKAFDFSKCTNLKTIGARAFHECRNYTSISLPASVECIGDSAFLAGSSDYPGILETVTIAENSNLNYIGKNAFADQTKLKTFSFSSPETQAASELKIDEGAFQHCSALEGASAEKGFVFPANTTLIGTNAFNGCSTMSQVTFLETPSIETIGANSFQNCGLTSITLPESVRYIENEAFNSCGKLEKVDIPAATEHIGAQAFLFCTAFKEYNVDPGNAVYSSVDGVLASKNKKTLYAFPPGKAATYYTMLSPSFETINDSAFYYCRNLKTVTLPKKVAKIGNHAFALCKELKRVNFLSEHALTGDKVDASAFNDINGNSQLPNIDLWVRARHKAEFEASDFWKNAKSINESFVVKDEEENITEEYFPLEAPGVENATDPGHASLISVKSDVTTFVVPQTVPGQTDYQVKLIGDYCFENCTTDVEEVVVPSGVDLEYVGARAFIKPDGVKKIANIFIVGSTPSNLATMEFGLVGDGLDEDYHGVADGQHIYVKKSALEDYKKAWHTLKDYIDYQIPYSMTSDFGTFAREFDVDFSENNKSAGKETAGWPNVIAFVAGKYADEPKIEVDDEGNETKVYYMRMHSINEGSAAGDGTYIPANTGVVMKAIDGASSTSGFYYQIHENDLTLDGTTDNRPVVGITVKSCTVPATETVNGVGYTNFLLSGGTMHKMTKPREFPAHRCYLRIPTEALTSGAKMMLTFDDYNGDPTEVELIANDGSLKPVAEMWYSLQGVRLQSAPTQPGIYIRNGKKTIIK